MKNEKNIIDYRNMFGISSNADDNRVSIVEIHTPEKSLTTWKTIDDQWEFHGSFRRKK
jgi:hypothetical protein